MNTHIYTNNTQQFTVNKKQVSKNNTLKSSVLYTKIESNVNSSLSYYHPPSNLHFTSIEFDIIKDAYLHDKLIIKSNVKKLSKRELILNITVTKKEEKKENIICVATFGYNLQKAS